MTANFRSGIRSLQTDTLVVVLIGVMIIYTLFTGVSKVTSAMREGFGGLDGSAIHSTVSLMQDAGSARAEKRLENKYKISVQDNTLRLNADFLPQPVTTTLPSGYTYAVAGSSPITTRKLCIRKHGMRYVFENAPCSDTGCTPGRCSVRTDDGTATAGYYCQNGAFTDKRFFQHYYTSTGASCNRQAGPFAAVNRFSCPDRVKDTVDVACVMTATWRCTGNSGSASIDIGGSTPLTTSISCDGEIHHRRFTASRSVSLTNTGSLSATGAVSIASQQSSKDETVTVVPG